MALVDWSGDGHVAELSLAMPFPNWLQTIGSGMASHLNYIYPRQMFHASHMLRSWPVGVGEEEALCERSRDVRWREKVLLQFQFLLC